MKFSVVASQAISKDSLQIVKAISSAKNSAESKKDKNPVEKTILKPINDVASIGLTAVGVVQIPEQVVFFPRNLNTAHNSIKALPILSKAAPTLLKTANYIETTKVFSIAQVVRSNSVMAKTSYALGKAAPYLNAAACGYAISKNIFILKNEKETTSHKAKAVTQMVLNTACAVGAFKAGKGTTISAVAGISTVGVAFLWK